jgi:hypothetical protein
MSDAAQPLIPIPADEIGDAGPSGDGCAECDAADGWWLHLRRCVTCGHVGCCDSSLGQHATAHFRATGHRFMQSFEPDEGWFWDFEADAFADGPALPPPSAHPATQPTPGPAGRVPADWQEELAGR